uniref:Uncharacterized protein n=1 Tax=Lymantria dispar multicapsid nuclear polyhedrosis virus TaxID=10449 RepID=A0A7S8F9V3_NPVLD|nr:hypothetical protein [Lymantria dispar multiple nucleopolyhedrovirus]QPD02037.1 hypothetical protein [Lymantria dispar multiple nucleopolyhedrovirus]
MRKRKFDLVRLSGAMLVDGPKTAVAGGILQRYRPEMFCVHFYYNGHFRTGADRAIACFCTRRTILNVLTDMLKSDEMNERVKKFCGFELVESGDGETTLVAHRDRLLYLLHNKFVFQWTLVSFTIRLCARPASGRRAWRSAGRRCRRRSPTRTDRPARARARTFPCRVSIRRCRRTPARPPSRRRRTRLWPSSRTRRRSGRRRWRRAARGSPPRRPPTCPAPGPSPCP